MKNFFWLFVSLLFFLFVCVNFFVELEDEDVLEDEDKEIVYNIFRGFELEELYYLKGSSYGLWVVLVEGDNGLFYVSDQWGDLYQFQIFEIGVILDFMMVDSVDLEIGRVYGLLWVFNSFYVSVNVKWEDDEGE